ncbi:MAG: hypothetical protein HY674_01905 [Chloroflexi bacterium]|nr:hypothetical protein [Chloroflexota bacterium]
MNRLFKSALLTGVFAIALIGSANSTMAQQQQDRQGRGDPEQFRQRMAERIRERLEVKDDSEWKILQERIEKVTQARRSVGFGGGGALAFGRRGGPGGPGGGQADANQPRRGPGGFGGEPSPEAEALQKALEGKASNEEIKAKLASLREARKANEAKLEKAQEELRKVLTVKQEAECVLMGLLR